MPEAVALPFWSKKQGFIARECSRCGHRGMFDIHDDPIMISDEVMCNACGSIAFKALTVDPTLEEASVEELVDAALDESENEA